MSTLGNKIQYTNKKKIDLNIKIVDRKMGGIRWIFLRAFTNEKV